MDTAQWPQPQDAGVMRSTTTSYPKAGEEHNKVARPQKEQGLNCPRCNSTNTKFCYYNNYSLSQPRYFCKTCRRYWTAGGSLRNIPVGGGSRKNKRPSSSSSSSNNNNSSAKHIKLNAPDPTVHDHRDLGLSFSRGFMGSSFMMPTGSSAGPVQEPAGPGLAYTSGFSSLPDHHQHHQFMMKPQSLNFSLDGLGLGSASVGSFPFQDLKQQAPSSSTQDHDHDHDHQQNGDMINISNGYWSGMLGGGGGSW